MLLTEEELARLAAVAPFLESEAKSALGAQADYEIEMELAEHLQPGLRVRARVATDARADTDTPPYPLDLFVGLPIDELRALSASDGAARDRMIAHFGATFSPRLLRAIAEMLPHEVDLQAGVQSEAGVLAVMLENAAASGGG
ncbi:hypothetical protein [Paraburkholderia sp.]|jgi:hypothetical protein|uniref:hypothetical protein n=1 Tax=Paraburkholderia sp. TaxID=1926495 RepID=UPI002F3E6F5B